MVHDEQSIQKPFAVITGASEWFGKEMAKQFASKGFDLIITGKDEGIHHSKDQLLKYGVSVQGHIVDLTTYNGVEDLYSTIKSFGHPLDALIINTEEGPEGSFINTNLNEEILVIRQNVLSPVHLIKRILKDMVLRGHGKIFVSSNFAPITGTGLEAVYAASKSFLFSFTEKIRTDFRGSGVTITTLLPNSHHKPSQSEMKTLDDPDELARESFNALMAGRDYVLEATIKTKLKSMLGRLIPDKARAFISDAAS
jgi:uncharacterized protein